MKRENAILFGPVFGELWWELYNFSPVFLYKKNKQYPSKVKFIVFTREDRFDIYGDNSDILVPLRIDGDGGKYKADCFRLINFPQEEVKNLTKAFNKKYSQMYNIIEHHTPDLRRYNDRNQFRQFRVVYNFKPREANKIEVNKYIPNGRHLVCLAPRFRSGIKRNWPHWQRFYDLVQSNKSLTDQFNFVLCGKPPDYIPDDKNRFYDINKICLDRSVSLIGLTIETLKRSTLTVGSQSGIPNISLLLGTEVLEWGHQKHLHTSSYNINRTPVTFIDDHKYNIAPEEIYSRMVKMLRKKTKKEINL